uniref:J domain-containing protein n=1 Tax=Chromera velia CCMP2878 TaxID=1169474 RepID=A0A0G4HJL8_9ALVE|mmetsp:Transcript_2874/g.5933  ORF Transcript_2874/g.5933 Transcript_2874/m.5933 type:complete len:324 (-) Transcript_2874:347-1318(-)|eukprot:Cvel_7108.t1-p1 / transcript=Cvel_7108.t1 / gene=Cvel_7108 / organism=Chromera_velia_CCMP2878 / gene_product=J domain-containing protein spf31, putative / transcript_product=J domain-containing protein spf31, putative / location=Cvel_scaffold364:28385-30966(+) / protein_length=323 / sequence_SO=supercontig / SO=protein_coding / is_pseudo=false
MSDSAAAATEATASSSSAAAAAAASEVPVASQEGDKEKQDSTLEAEEDGEGQMPEEDTSAFDAAFSMFLSEVDTVAMPTGKIARPVRTFTKDGGMVKLGNAKEQVLRLTSKVFTNPYEVLLLTPDSSEEDAKKMYRKLSLMIHPDKCKEPGAADAFDVLQKAQDELGKAENKEKYAKVIGEARNRVMKRRKEENAKREKAKEPLLPEDEAEINRAVMEECDKMLNDIETKRSYAETVLAANERFEKQQEEQMEQDEQERMEKKQKFKKEMESRVHSWQAFKKSNNSKVDKRVEHKREMRPEDDEEARKKHLMGIDTSYKNSWR